MRGTDRFLLVIVVGALVVAAAAAATTLLRPNTVDYRPDDSAEGVAYNYALAMQRGDYARAYGYVSASVPNYPATLAAFASDLGALGSPRAYGMDGTASLDAGPAQISGDVATVTVRETWFYSNGLFDSGERQVDYNVVLRREAAGWRIVNNERYWSGRWQNIK